MAAAVHRQETVDCLKKFNARRKLKVSNGGQGHLNSRTSSRSVMGSGSFEFRDKATGCCTRFVQGLMCPESSRSILGVRVIVTKDQGHC